MFVATGAARGLKLIHIPPRHSNVTIVLHPYWRGAYAFGHISSSINLLYILPSGVSCKYFLAESPARDSAQSEGQNDWWKANYSTPQG